jgi:hypothetical protein
MTLCGFGIPDGEAFQLSGEEESLVRNDEDELIGFAKFPCGEDRGCQLDGIQGAKALTLNHFARDLKHGVGKWKEMHTI